MTRLPVLLSLALATAGCPRGDETREPPPAAPAPGQPARGADIAAATLDRYLPPAPGDAVPYEVRHPLNNGPTVPVKKRWIWIPARTKIRLAQVGDNVEVDVPVGALLWKEFYLRAGKQLGLVERRILRKVPSRDQDNGWLLNGGWRLYTAHHLPPRADGITGFKNALTEPLDRARDYFFPPKRWMPTQNKSAWTFVTFTGAGARYPYVFPGKTQCMVCHEGAEGAYGNPRPRRVLAFGPHPENLTAASFRALVKRGWIDAPAALIARYSRDPRPTDDRVATLVATLRNNCLSCHNSAPGAVGRETAFVLDPNGPYTPRSLVAALSRESVVMGQLGHPVVTAGAPGQSELVLRLKGERGRRRMPPAEGGLPDRDQQLIDLATGWVEGLSAAP